MSFRELVEKRYSCRRYESAGVEREKINECVKAARSAPSACNAQPWRFLVIDDPGVLEGACAAAVSGVYRMSRFIKGAPVLIAVLADKGSFLSKMGSLVRDAGFYLIDIGIACEHLVLQASELGLGTCYVGWFNEKALKKNLGIPKKLRVPLLISMGYPSEEYRKKDPIRRRAGSETRKDLKEILYFNSLR